MKLKPIKVVIRTGVYKNSSGSYKGMLCIYATNKIPIVHIRESFPYETDGTVPPDMSGYRMIGLSYEKAILKMALEKLSEEWQDFFYSLKKTNHFSPRIGWEFCEECKKNSKEGVKLKGERSFTLEPERWLPKSWTEHKKGSIFSYSPGVGKTTRTPNFLEEGEYGYSSVLRRKREE